METLTLTAATRSVFGRKRLQALRQAGQLPAVLYGQRVATRSLVLPQHDFLNRYQRAGGSRLIALAVDGGAPVTVMVQMTQTDPVTRKLLHVDFHQVDLTKKVTAVIQLRFAGVAPAVKEAGGVLMTNLTELTVKGLPEDLVADVPVDLTSLKTFHDYLHVRDIPLPAGVTALAKPDEVVVHVVAPRSEEELQALDQQPAVAASDAPLVAKEEPTHAEGTAPPASGSAGRGKAGKG